MRWSPVGGNPQPQIFPSSATHCQPGGHFLSLFLIYFLQQGPQHLATIHHSERRVITGPPAQELGGQLYIS